VKIGPLLEVEADITGMVLDCATAHLTTYTINERNLKWKRARRYYSYDITYCVTCHTYTVETS